MCVCVCVCVCLGVANVKIGKELAELCGLLFGQIQVARVRRPCRQKRIAHVIKGCAPTIRVEVQQMAFQKAIAVELENVQARMARTVIDVTRLPTETLDQYDRRRKTLARDLCCKAGSWASVWAQRCIDWDAHVRRSAARDTTLAKLWTWHDQRWLQEQRSRFVASTSMFAANVLNNPRNNIWAGNTGTRARALRPQPRFCESLNLAREVVSHKRESRSSQHVLSIHTILQRASAQIRGLFSDGD